MLTEPSPLPIEDTTDVFTAKFLACFPLEYVLETLKKHKPELDPEDAIASWTLGKLLR